MSASENIPLLKSYLLPPLSRSFFFGSHISSRLTLHTLFCYSKAEDVNYTADQLSVQAKRIHLVDSGLMLNSPYPLLLRPQREMDVFFSFDFSNRERDEEMPFKVSSTYFTFYFFVDSGYYLYFLVGKIKPDD